MMKMKINKKALFFSLVILSVFILGCSRSPLTGGIVQEKGAGGDLKEINVNAFQFGYDPDTITVKKGDRIKMNINNSDVLHGIMIPDLGLRGDETLEFTADKQGEFVWYCANLCGQGHLDMQGKLIVE